MNSCRVQRGLIIWMSLKETEIQNDESVSLILNCNLKLTSFSII